MEFDSFAKEEIRTDVTRIDTLLSCNIFAPVNKTHPLLFSAFIELMICLQDLVSKASTAGARINFKDHIYSNPGKEGDVTALISDIRACVCHIQSPKHRASNKNIVISFNVMYGKGIWTPVKEVSLESEFEDDTCFFFGEHKIYLGRHIVRAYKEAKTILMPMIKIIHNKVE